MLSLRVKLAVGVAVLGMAGVGTAAVAHDRSRFDASLSGYEELPTLSTQGAGSFKASLNRGQDEIHYELSYRGPFDANAAGGTVTQAHIHLGAKAFSGGVSAFLCSNLGNGPVGTPACPPTGGTVTGVIKAAQVVGPGQPGHPRGRVRRARAGDAGRRDLRQRAHDHVRPRRDPRPDLR